MGAAARVRSIMAIQMTRQTTATTMMIFLIRSADIGEPRVEMVCGGQDA